MGIVSCQDGRGTLKEGADPPAVKAFGIIDDVLHSNDEQEVTDTLKGVPGGVYTTHDEVVVVPERGGLTDA